MKLRPILFALAMWLPVTAAASENSKAGTAQRGAAKYHDYGCVLCHGSVGQSSAFGNAALDPQIPIEGLRYKLRNKSGMMPVFSEKILTEQDVQDIHAFLKTFPR